MIKVKVGSRFGQRIGVCFGLGCDVGLFQEGIY